MSTAKNILEKHYQKNLSLCEKGKSDWAYLKDKYAHSYSTLECGTHISQKIEIEKDIVSSVLLLHDIGRFYEHYQFPNFKHAEFGYEILKKENIKNTIILLPIKYHETENWQEALSLDVAYKKLSVTEKHKVKLLCQLLVEADIIDNMRIQSKIHKNEQFSEIHLNRSILEKFFSGSLADNKNVKNCADAIVYILCGLSAIHLNESKKYIRDNQVVTNLINELFSIAKKANNTELKDNVNEIKDYIHETYNF